MPSGTANAVIVGRTSGGCPQRTDRKTRRLRSRFHCKEHHQNTMQSERRLWKLNGETADIGGAELCLSGADRAGSQEDLPGNRDPRVANCGRAHTLRKLKRVRDGFGLVPHPCRSWIGRHLVLVDLRSRISNEECAQIGCGRPHGFWKKRVREGARLSGR
jgi:hypothetical protein